MLEDGARIVLVDRNMTRLRCPAVATDNARVGKLATQHLISLGHRRIGHLCGDGSSMSAERRLGYGQALANHKLRIDESLVRPCGLLESEGYLAMRAWIAKGDVPDAIFVVNDPAAIGAMQAIEEAGLQVGRDVALVGAGNIHYGDMLRVPLTTVSWSRSEMGQQAARMLIQFINGEAQDSRARNIVLEPELIVRTSCGAKSPGGAERSSGKHVS
jgi:DNA-binding LacI/PurR family transcriptional regulator